MTSAHKLSMLVVDDEVELREMIAEMFEDEGFTVTKAENGRVAFGLLTSSSFDVLFSDVRMPGGDGIELLEKIQQSRGSLKAPRIFLCSGYNDLTPERAVELGVIRMFGKPFNVSEVVAAVVSATTTP
jgi:two-component system response regulator HydG